MSLFRKSFQNREKLYFLHIPKTAGSSVSRALFQIADKKELRMIGPVLLDHLAEMPDWNESNVLAGHLGLLPLHYKFEYFTVLRDPLDRLYSYFSHVKRAPDHYFNRIVVEENLDFLDYLLDQRFHNLNFNMQTRYLSAMPRLGDLEGLDALTPMAYEFENSSISEISLKQALRTLERALWVGDINNLSQLGLFLEKRFQIPKIDFPFLNLDPRIRQEFTPLEIEAAKPLIELDTIIYQRWKSPIRP
jgi:hypothetical protein